MRILIVEDESRALKRLTRLTRLILGEAITSLDTATRLSNAQSFISSESIDLLLLDLNLKGKDGFETLKSVAGQSFQTIIVSAYHDRAMKAFEYGVLDFVPKPVERNRLNRALQRFLKHRNSGTSEIEQISVRLGRKVEFVSVDDVLYFSGARDYTEIHLMDGRTHLCEKRLTAVETLLVKSFIRIHRSFIVRRDHIRAIRTFSGSAYSIELKNGLELSVGRTRIKQVRKELSSRSSI